MNATVFVTMLVTLAVSAAIVYVLPSMMPRTVPLGVNVPTARMDEPVIRSSMRRYRLLVAGSWLVAVAVLALLVFVVPVVAALVSILLLVAGTTVAYIVARQSIVRAKRDGRWYAEATVRIAGSITPDSTRAPVPAGWFAASLLLLAVAFTVGISVYASLPAQLPTHWGIDGLPDRFAAKSVWTVFAPLIIVTVVDVGLFALSFLNRVVTVRPLAAATAEQNAARKQAVQAVMSAMLGRTMFVITLGLSWVSVVSWLWPGARGLITAGILVMVALLLVSVVTFIVRWRRAVGSATAAGGTVDAPDEDRYWKGGILYLNADDPALFVQRRFGAGWTVNLGHPAGIAIGVGFLVVIATVLIIAVTARAR